MAGKGAHIKCRRQSPSFSVTREPRQAGLAWDPMTQLPTRLRLLRLEHPLLKRKHRVLRVWEYTPGEGRKERRQGEGGGEDAKL